jgi:hypothetical protein
MKTRREFNVGKTQNRRCAKEDVKRRAGVRKEVVIGHYILWNFIDDTVPLPAVVTKNSIRAAGLGTLTVW